MKETYLLISADEYEDREKRHMFTRLQNNIYDAYCFDADEQMDELPRTQVLRQRKSNNNNKFYKTIFKKQMR